jgi:DNA replication protein DnaC
MTTTETIKDYCSRLRLYQLPKIFERQCHIAREQDLTHAEFLCSLLEKEVNSRDEKDLIKRLKAANLPPKHDLSEFDFNYSHSLSESRLRELRELAWMEQAFNIILMGPSGTGKTYIAAGLVHDAVQRGFRASLMTMEDIVSIIRLKDLAPTYLAAYNRVLKLHLLAIDDIMMFPMKKEEATAFFNLINTLHEKTSIIITTNKSPTEWAERLDDEVLAAAILDRLMFKCQVIKLSGESYRMSNRQSIFKD